MIGSFYPILMLSGILWPVEAMPDFLQKISWYFPNTATAQAMRDVMTKGWDITFPSVQLGLGVIGAWIVLFNVLTFIALKIKSP